MLGLQLDALEKTASASADEFLQEQLAYLAMIELVKRNRITYRI